MTLELQTPDDVDLAIVCSRSGRCLLWAFLSSLHSKSRILTYGNCDL